MDTLNNVWGQFTDKETIKEAILNASKGKKKYRHVRKILRTLDESAAKLAETLRDGAFVPSPYVTDTIKTEFGKEREIFKLPFYPDRCVQHDISIVNRPRWNKSLTNDTYACLQDRGINCKIKRWSLNTKVKRAIMSYRGRRVYVLVLDIRKCYPSVDNAIMARTYRRYCRDKRLLEVMDAINYLCDGLPIGNFLSQLWINIYLTILDRYVKEELGARHYFRYLDDMVLMSEDKAELHQWEHRIMNFLWYELHMEVNQKRQIFPLGRNLSERGLDYGGIVFRQWGRTRLRKRIKKAYIKKLGKPRSEPSYLGMMKHLDCKNLIRSIAAGRSAEQKDDKDMELSKLINRKIERPFEGDNIKIEQIIDKEIEVLDFDVRPSEKKPNSLYLKMQIRYEGRKRFVGGGYSFLCEVLQQIDKSNLPFTTTIRNKRGYYFDGTIDEE